jgi:GlpG protein
LEENRGINFVYAGRRYRYGGSVMRLIGHVAKEDDARTVGNYLLVRGIENQLERQEPEGWGIWVLEEDRIATAEQILAEFRAHPADPKYQTEGKAAREIRLQAQKDLEAYQKKVRDRRHLFRPLRAYGFGPLTFVLIVISVVVFIKSGFGRNLPAVMSLFIAPVDDDGIYFRGLLEVRHGQVWRLLTPIFVHMDILHILFNMLWLKDLGSMIEARHSTLWLGLFVVGVGIVSNAAQFFVSGPLFGGMSGVVYGLLGYIWIRGKFDPGSGLFLHPSTVTLMLVWYALGLTGIMNIANTVHTVGLGLGMAVGYLSSLRHR